MPIQYHTLTRVNTRNRRACKKKMMHVDMAKYVCQDRRKCKSMVSAYPDGKRPKVCTYVLFIPPAPFYCRTFRRMSGYRAYLVNSSFRHTKRFRSSFNKRRAHEWEYPASVFPKTQNPKIFTVRLNQYRLGELVPTYLVILSLLQGVGLLSFYF